MKLRCNGCWYGDERQSVYLDACLFCRGEAETAVLSPSGKRSLASARTVNAVVSLARYDERIATRGADWENSGFGSWRLVRW
jgi:hypothetical protein